MKALHKDHDPIAALATGREPAALAVIRVAGSGCHDLVRRCLPDVKGDLTFRQVRLVTFCDPTTNEEIDRPLVVFFRAPQSYSGEDGVELYLHGGPYIVKRALDALYACGIRAAEPGEFTRRAFLGGKLDLSEAEGIHALIRAETEQQWLAARFLAGGRLGDLVGELRRQLIDGLAYLETLIDFPDEEDVSSVRLSDVDVRVERVASTLNRLIGTYASGRIASRGLGVAIVGPANAGKSTFLNWILQEERAIVSPTPGTTRDFIEEACSLQGRLVRFIDTAGLRDSSCAIEQQGIERALKLAQDADIVLGFFPVDGDPQEFAEFATWLSQQSFRSVLHCLTKAELPSPLAFPADWLPISCHTGLGLPALEAQLVATVDRHMQALRGDSFVSSPRHHQALLAAQAGLSRYVASRATGAYEEVLAFELRESLVALTEIIGRVDADDLLDVVFSSFCIGK